MKRSALKRKTPLRPSPSRDAQVLGGRARARQMQQAAGIPDDAPRNEQGRSCVEKICPVCEQTFLVWWTRRHSQRTCSAACAGIAKRKKGRDRQGAANPNFRHGRRSGVRDREGERRWYAALALMHGCQHPACPGERSVVVLHHVIYRQKVRRVSGDLFDPRNALSLCDSCHTSHHRRGSRVVPLRALTDANYEFAYELLGQASYDYLQLRYTGDDPRLEALLCETT